MRLMDGANGWYGAGETFNHTFLGALMAMSLLTGTDE